MMSWNCANDSGDSVKLNPPPEQGRLSQSEKSFAQGNAEAILAEGGPEDFFIWAHLHGIHGDRYGETNYTMSALVKDEKGYYYMGTDVLKTTVEGVPDKPKRHRHCYAQFEPDPEEGEKMRRALQRGRKFEIEIVSDRDRNDIKWATDSIKDIIKDLNKGKEPE